jgi:hypothetical protein
VAVAVLRLQLGSAAAQASSRAVISSPDAGCCHTERIGLATMLSSRKRVRVRMPKPFATMIAIESKATYTREDLVRGSGTRRQVLVGADDGSLDRGWSVARRRASSLDGRPARWPRTPDGWIHVTTAPGAIALV